jgi:hypothetical protein
MRMGGIGLGLLVIVFVVMVAAAISLYLTGGVFWWRKTDPGEDRVEGSDAAGGGERRPVHTHPTSPYHENTEFVGTPPADDAEGPRREP